MYVPVGQRGQGRGGAPNVQQQVVSQQGSGIASAIRAADASLQAKKNEARRIYERAETQMRTDLNDAANFDATQAGTDAAPVIQAAADELRTQIQEANDPVKARQLIADFKQKFNLLKAREDQRKEDATQLNDMSVMTGSQMAGLNSALPPGMEYDEVDASSVARADEAFRQNFQLVDGEIVVEDADGNLVPIDEADFINDTSAYMPSQRKVDVGDLQTSAQNEAIQTRIINRSKTEADMADSAKMEYDTLTENNNRSGITLRMQINEDYGDESGNSTFFDSPEQTKAFEIGPNGFSRVEGNEELEAAWREVWGEPGAARTKDDDGNITNQGSGWELLNTEREKFVEYAVTAIKNKRTGGGGKKQTGSRYAVGVINVTTDQRRQDALASGAGAGAAGIATAEGYQMIGFVDPKDQSSAPIEVEGSDYLGLEKGKYLIQGFGVDPLYGITADGVEDMQESQPMASVTVETTKNQYKSANGETISEEEYNKLDADSRVLYEVEEVKVTSQKRIPIGPETGRGVTGEGVAIYNRIIKTDPQAAALLQQELQKANKARSNYMVATDLGRQQSEAREEAAQQQANQAAEQSELEAQQERDRRDQELGNARNAQERTKIIQRYTFTDDKKISGIDAPIPVYEVPEGLVREGAFWLYQGNKVGKAYRYEDAEGNNEFGIVPLRN